MCTVLQEIMAQDFHKVRAEGEAIGSYKTLAQLVKKKLITVADAAAEAGVTESEFVEKARLALG